MREKRHQAAVGEARSGSPAARGGPARDTAQRLSLRLADSAEWRERLKPCDGCDECGARCVDGFQVTRQEYLRLKEYWESLPVEERERLGGRPRELPWPGAPEFSYTACRFRDPENGRCSVYPVRPLICRLFGHAEWLPCPIGRIPGPSPDSRLIIEEYAREELRTIEEWEQETEGVRG